LIDFEPGPAGQGNGRAHTNPRHDEIGRETLTVLQHHMTPLQLTRRLAEMEDHAVGFVERPNEVAELDAEHALEGARARSDDVHFDASVTQRGGDLEPDEARPEHDRAASCLGGLDDPTAVGKGAKVMDGWTGLTGNREPQRLGTGR